MAVYDDAKTDVKALIDATAGAGYPPAPKKLTRLGDIAVDYDGAVVDGQIKSASEYAEVTEFAASVSTRIAARATSVMAAILSPQQLCPVPSEVQTKRWHDPQRDGSRRAQAC